MFRDQNIKVKHIVSYTRNAEYPRQINATQIHRDAERTAQAPRIVGNPTTELFVRGAIDDFAGL